jgi:hypothetical protein
MPFLYDLKDVDFDARNVSTSWSQSPPETNSNTSRGNVRTRYGIPISSTSSVSPSNTNADSNASTNTLDVNHSYNMLLANPRLIRRHAGLVARPNDSARAQAEQNPTLSPPARAPIRRILIDATGPIVQRANQIRRLPPGSMTHVRSIEIDRVERQLVRIRSLLEASDEPTREERIREVISIMHRSERATRDQQLIQRQTQQVINGSHDGPMNGTEGSAGTEAADG